MFHSLSRRSCIKWHRTSNVSHYAKLRRAVPVSQGAPSFMADTVMVQPCSPALLLWEQALTVLPGLFCLGLESHRQPWGLLKCQYNLHFSASLCSKFSALLVFYINWFYGPRCFLVLRMEQIHRQVLFSFVMACLHIIYLMVYEGLSQIWLFPHICPRLCCVSCSLHLCMLF